MSDALIGYLAKYEIWDTAASPAVFFELEEVIDINRGEESSDMPEVTHYQSPNRRREYTAGLRTRSAGTVAVNWIPGNETEMLLRRLADSGEKVQHRLTLRNGRNVTFDAMVMSLTESLPIDDRMTLTASVQATGDEEWADAEEPVEPEGGEG
jgi:hypothetical protein